MQPEPKKHVSHWIAWSVIVLAVGLVGFATWYYYDQIATIYDNTIVATIKPSTKTTTPSTTSATADWKTYTNSTYGFSLTFGNIWKGYTVKEEKATDSLSTESISFHLKTTDQSYINQLKTDDVKPFVITVYTLSQWDNAQKEEGPKPAYINKNTQYVFAYSTWQDQTISDMQAINADIKNVISTFQFTS